MPESGLGAGWFDQLRADARGVGPKTLAEWSEIIERKANVCLKDGFTKIKFKGTVDEKNEFKLDMDVPTSASVLCLLEAIQSCLDFMPSSTKVFYSALLEALVSEAEKRDH